MSGRTHGVSLPLGTMEDHKARFRCCPERSGTWRKSVLIGGTWQRTKVACDLLKRIFDNQLEAGSRCSEGKPSGGPADRVDDLISSIRKRRGALKRTRTLPPHSHADDFSRR